MIAFTFPGQGSQKPAMGEAWRNHPSFALVGAASEVAGRDVARLLLDADADELRATDNAQLATFVLSLVVGDAVARAGIGANVVAGHSLGEYTALVAARAISFEEGVALVTERGAAMAEAAGERPGTMAAVLGLDDAAIEEACAEVRAAGGEVWVANANAPGQVVIAGSADAIEQAGGAAKARGAKRVMPIAVSGAFHTPFMAPAQARLDRMLASVRYADSVVGVAANTDAAVHTASSDWPGLLSRQLTSPVRWADLLRTLAGAGASTFVELGPGAVLTGMAKRTLTDVRTFSATTPQEVDTLVSELATLIAPADQPPTDGEHLFATERLVVSPAAGVFTPDDHLRDGDPIAVGQVLGRVGEHEVRSRFTGWLMGLLALQGERVTTRQPVAWLRIAP